MQSDFPNLPPMEPIRHSHSPSSTMQPPSHPSATASFAPKRLRQIVSAITGGGMVIIALLIALELIAAPGKRPTDLAAMIEARTESGIFNQKMGAAPGQLILTEDQYREKIAEAERAGQARAELAFQEKLAVVQANQQRVVGAYQTLHQRANIIAQAGVQMEQVALQFRQRLVEQSNGGRVVVQNFTDIGCALQIAGACEAADNYRRNMVEQSSELTETQVAAKVNALMAGIPDPASLIVNEDIERHGTPALPR